MTVFDDSMLELLGGYLDGELTAEELRRVEQLLASDSKVQTVYQELLAIREMLTELPRATLPSSFSQHVLSQASVRAEGLGVDAPSWIRLKARPVGSSSSSSQQSAKIQRWARILVVGLAASLAGVAIVWQSVTDRSMIIQPIAELPVPTQELASSSLATSTESQSGVSSEGPAVESIAGALKDSDSQTDASPEVELRHAEQALDQPSPTQSVVELDGKKEGGDGRQLTEPMKAGSSTEDLKVASNLTTDEQELLKNATEALNRGDRLRVLAIIDLTVSEEAWEKKTVEFILNKYDIAMDSPVLVTDAMQQDLSASRMIGVSEMVDGAVEVANDQVALVYVKAKSDRLDLAIREMTDREDDFPQLMMDMAMDLPGQEAIKNLESIREFADAEIGEGRKLGVARSLVRTTTTQRPNGLVAQFPAPTPRGRAMNRSGQDQLAPNRSSARDMNPVSYCLFILRRPQ